MLLLECEWSSSLTNKQKKGSDASEPFFVFRLLNYFIACSTATATATVAPTIGLLPMPR